jgi:hypothetical protein
MADKRILLVEGTDDKNVLMHICGNRGIGKLDEIKTHEGDVKLLDGFPAQLKESRIKVLGIVLDADTDASARWDAIGSRLTKAGYGGVPSQPAPDGTIVEPPTNSVLPRFGVWIMPDNRSMGKLEDFLRFLVPAARRRLFAHVKFSVQGIPEEDRLFSKPDETKALIHTWLAWQKEPGRPFGTAITAKFLDPNVPQVDVLVAWMKRLFFP